MHDLTKQILNCRKCSLGYTRKNPIIGEGCLRAKTLMIGEAPGYHEDMEGKPFIGNAGKILDKLLKEVNLSREEIYITNVLKCHPPKNRNPLPEEINSCIGYLYAQIKIIRPEIIITLGKFASKELFSKVRIPFSKISDMHGKTFEIKSSFGMVKIAAVYHPSTVCYNPPMFDTLNNDFKKIFSAFCKKK